MKRIIFYCLLICFGLFFLYFLYLHLHYKGQERYVRERNLIKSFDFLRHYENENNIKLSDIKSAFLQTDDIPHYFLKINVEYPALNSISDVIKNDKIFDDAVAYQLYLLGNKGWILKEKEYSESFDDTLMINNIGQVYRCDIYDKDELISTEGK